MRKVIITYLFLTFLTVLYTPRAEAIVVKDALTKAQDKMEEIIEVMKTAEEKISKLEAEQRDTKIGEFGKKALEGYNEITKKLKQERRLAPLDIPEFLGGTVNDVKKTTTALKKNYTTTFRAGEGTTKSKQQKRQDMETLHNNVATLYSKAYVIRQYLKKARETQEDPQVELKDSRSIIQAGRAYAEQTNRRLLDIINMEMTQLEFENTVLLFSSSTSRNDIATWMEEINE